MKKVLLILLVLIALFTLASCAPVDCDCPTATDVPVETATDVAPTDTPDLDPKTWWEHPTTSTWPKEVDGYKVCYLQVIVPELIMKHEYSNNGVARTFLISTVKDLRPGQDTIPSRRVIAKEDKIIMVMKSPAEVGEGAGIYAGVPFSKYCRPFKGDGGNHAFRIMRYNIIDGIYMGDHPETPLYLPLGLSGEYAVTIFHPDW